MFIHGTSRIGLRTGCCAARAHWSAILVLPIEETLASAGRVFGSDVGAFLRWRRILAKVLRRSVSKLAVYRNVGSRMDFTGIAEDKVKKITRADALNLRVKASTVGTLAHIAAHQPSPMHSETPPRSAERAARYSFERRYSRNTGAC